MEALWLEWALEMWKRLLESGFIIPSGDIITRARPRLDLVCMLLQRRLLFDGPWSRKRNPNRAIHLTFDSSPVLGANFFGVIAYLVLEHGTIELILPGCMLAHGYAKGNDKLMCILWAIWLVAGLGMLEFLEDLKSMCTDHGVESDVASKGNVLKEFCSYHKVCLPLYALGRTYTFPNCVEVPDWDHAISELL